MCVRKTARNVLRSGCKKNALNSAECLEERRMISLRIPCTIFGHDLLLSGIPFRCLENFYNCAKKASNNSDFSL